MRELSGFAVLDKPTGLTSHDVVAKARRLLNTRKVGHAGTLDPMATGVLILGVGRATRLLTFLVGADKGYDATIRLGITTNTDDADGEVLVQVPVVDLLPQALAQAVAALTGAINQVPSAVSAIKVRGQRSYVRARAGQLVDLPARPVTVAEFTIRETRTDVVNGLPVLDVEVRTQVSSGTYIRALARDLGGALGVGGHLTQLRRTRVGGFSLDQACGLTDFHDKPELLPIPQVAARIFPGCILTAAQVTALRFGQQISGLSFPGDNRDQPLAGYAPDGELVALLGEVPGSDRWKPVLVIPVD